METDGGGPKRTSRLGLGGGSEDQTRKLERRQKENASPAEKVGRIVIIVFQHSIHRSSFSFRLEDTAAPSSFVPLPWQMYSSTMEYCRPTRSGAVNGINRPPPALDSPSRSSSANISSPEHLYLFPDTSTPRSHTSTFQKATPVWLQYLSQILSRPAKQAAPVQQPTRTGPDISPSSTKLLPYASRTKERAPSRRAPKLDYETTSIK